MINNILSGIVKKLTVNNKGSINLSDLNKYLNSNPIIIEAGAHIGVDSISMSKHWPKATIHSFEPVSDVYRQLVANTKDRLNIHPHNIALGGSVNKVKMFISGGESDGSSSLLEPKEHLIDHPNVVFNTTEMVECTTIDQWSKDNNISNIDMMWLDMQGGELNALRKGQHALKYVRVIYSEVSLKEVYSGGCSYNDLKNWLCSKGFKVSMEFLPWNDMGNVLFTRSQ